MKLHLPLSLLAALGVSIACVSTTVQATTIREITTVDDLIDYAGFLNDSTIVMLPNDLVVDPALSKKYPVSNIRWIYPICLKGVESIIRKIPISLSFIPSKGTDGANPPSITFQNLMAAPSIFYIDNIEFTGLKNVSFLSNKTNFKSAYVTEEYNGGTLHAKSFLSMRKNQSVTFDGNRACGTPFICYRGAAIYADENAHVDLSDNGSLVFRNQYTEVVAPITPGDPILTYYSEGGAIYAKKGATVNMTGNTEVVFQNNTVNMRADNPGMQGFGHSQYATGGAISVGENGVLDISSNGSVLFEQNKILLREKSHVVEGFGGAIYLGTGAKATLNNNKGEVVFRDNVVGYDFALNNFNAGGVYIHVAGGAICVNDLASLTMNGNDMVKFENNQISVHIPESQHYRNGGGAVSVRTKASFAMSENGGIIFSGNTYKTQYVGSYNNQDACGGAIHASEGASIQLYRNTGDIIFEKNIATIIPDAGADFSARDVCIQGGAIVAQEGAVICINDNESRVSFTSNAAANHKDALNIQKGGEYAYSSYTISTGGAIFAERGTRLEINRNIGLTFTDNQAISYATFYDSFASGGAIACEGLGTELNGHQEGILFSDNKVLSEVLVSKKGTQNHYILDYSRAYGGAIALSYSDSYLNVHDNKMMVGLVSNSATAKYQLDSDLTGVEHGRNERATRAHGGAIYAGGSTSTISFQGNSEVYIAKNEVLAESNVVDVKALGGAVYVEGDSKLLFLDNVGQVGFFENKAQANSQFYLSQAYGGAICAAGEKEALIEFKNNTDGVIFSSNSATSIYNSDGIGATGASEAKGGAIYGTAKTKVYFQHNTDVTLTGNFVQADSSSYIAKAYGGAVLAESGALLSVNDNTGEIEFSGNYANARNASDVSYAFGGAIATGESAQVYFGGNASKINFNDNRVNAEYTGSVYQPEKNPQAKGGAIYSHEGTQVVFENNKSEISFSGNLTMVKSNVSRGSSYGGAINVDSRAGLTLRNNIGAITFRGNHANIETAYGAYAYGGAVAGGLSSLISITGNTGKITFDSNYVNAQSYATDSYAHGGAIFAASGSTIDISSNSGGVDFINNQATGKAESGLSTYGAAIYSLGDILIQNNGDVLFSKNAEINGTSIRMRGIYLDSQSEGGGKFHLSAAEGKSIVFEDCVYAKSSKAPLNIVLNGDYTDAQNNSIAQTGSIVFDGSKVVQHLSELKPQGVSPDDVTASYSSYLLGQIKLQNGSLVVRSNAVLTGAGLVTAADSGAAVVLHDGVLIQSAPVNFSGGTSLNLSGENVMHGTEVNFLDGSSLNFTLTSEHREAGGYAALSLLEARLNIGKINLTIDGVNMYDPGRYMLLKLSTSASQYVVDSRYWNAENITVTGTGDAAGLGFNDLQWENGILYLNQGVVEWNNGSGDELWNIESSVNWLRSNAPIKYSDGMTVLFGGLGTGEVHLEKDVAPANVFVSNAEGKDYIFTGPGKITGASALVKEGEGKLTLTSANAYTGGTVVRGGQLVVQHAEALGHSAAALITESGSELIIDANTALVRGKNATDSINGRVEVTAGSSLKLQSSGYMAESTKVDGTLTFSTNDVHHTGADAADTTGSAGSLSGSGTVWLDGAGSSASFSSLGSNKDDAFSGSLMVKGPSSQLSVAEGTYHGGGTLSVSGENAAMNLGAVNVTLTQGGKLELNALTSFSANSVVLETGATLISKQPGTEVLDMANGSVSGTLDLGLGLVLQGGATYQALGSHIDLNNSALTLDFSNGDSAVNLRLSLGFDSYESYETKIVLFSGVSSLTVDSVTYQSGTNMFAAADYLTGSYVTGPGYEDMQLVFDSTEGIVYLQQVAPAIPEPTTVTLSLLALAALAARRRRK